MDLETLNTQLTYCFEKGWVHQPARNSHNIALEMHTCNSAPFDW